MITKKLWNSFTDSTRGQILELLGYHCTGIYARLCQPYNHDFDFDTAGKELKKILESCYYVEKTGDIKVTILLRPSYTPKVKAKTSTTSKQAALKVGRKLKKYICYYEKRINGELVDDFKEWTEAYSKEEAREHFKDEYRHNPNIEISMIVED